MVKEKKIAVLDDTHKKGENVVDDYKEKVTYDKDLKINMSFGR